jgi:hypothetical protein
MAHQKIAHLREQEHQTSMLHDDCRTVSLEASPCSLEPPEKTQKKTHRIVKVEQGIGKEAGGASGKSKKDNGSTRDAGEASVVGHG